VEDSHVPNKRTWLRLSWVLIPAVAFLGLLVFAVLDVEEPPGPGDSAPGWEADLLGASGRLSLDDLKGRPVLLNFWASWCEPCEDEAAILRQAWTTYKDDVAFVGIDIKDGRSAALAFVERYGLDYVHVRDEDLEIYDDYGLTGQPESFFIDSDGIIVEHVNGPFTEDTLYQLLDILVRRDA